MALGIVSENLIAIWLFMSDFNTDMETEELVSRISGLERENQDYFGADEGDMASSFFHLAYYSGWLSECDPMKVRLETWIPAALKRDHAYFNDEGCYWEETSFLDLPPRKRHEILKDLFKPGVSLAPERIEKELIELGWHREYVRFFMRRQLEAEDSPVIIIDGHNLYALGQGASSKRELVPQTKDIVLEELPFSLQPID